MGYSLRVLMMDFRRLEAVPGSRDQRLLAALRPQLEHAWDDEDQDEEDLDDPDAEDDDEYAPQVTPLQALENILNGAIPKQRFGGEAYSLAVATLYLHLGADLDELHLSSHDMGHLGQVEAALKAAGASQPLSLVSLAHAGAPFHLPSGEPFPCIGFLTAQQVIDARRLYDEMSLLDIQAGLRETVERFAGWLKTAASRKCGLVAVLD